VVHVSADDGDVAAGLPDTEFTEEIVRTFDRNWAVGIMSEALARTREEYATAGKTKLFEALKSYLPAGKEPPAYGPMAEELGLHLATLKTEIHRLRLAFRTNVRAEVAQTVSAPHEVEAELAWLQQILMDRGSRLQGAEAV
jgi:RNA polymerase sigma-70 factor (ECF subfamily)